MKFQSTRKKKEKRKSMESMRLFSFHICQYVCCFSSFCYHYYHHHHHHHHQRFIILVRVGRLLLVCTIELHKRSITAPSILDKIIKKGIDFVWVLISSINNFSQNIKYGFIFRFSLFFKYCVTTKL